MVEAGRALLDLSTSLAGIVSTDEVVAKIADGVPAIIDCDRALVVLVDAPTAIARIAATSGYTHDADRRLRALCASMPVTMPSPTTKAEGSGDERGTELVETLIAGSGSSGTIAVTIVINGSAIGWLAATVTETPERLLGGDVAVDLAGFKDVNDTLGHAAGDQLLQAAPRRGTGGVRRCRTGPGDLIAMLSSKLITVVV
jgi:hypothetical protein